MAVAVTVRLLGVPVRVTFPFSALITLLLYIDRTGLMGYSLLAVILHELGHLAAMHTVKAKPKEFLLSLRGILIVSPTLPDAPQRLWVAVAGPLSNALCGGLFFLFGCKVAAAVQWIVALYNLLPIRGLDGGSILEALLCLCGAGEKEWILTLCSFFTAGVVFVLGIQLLLLNGSNISLLLLGVYLLFLNLLKV